MLTGPAAADAVYKQACADFPKEAAQWILAARWQGPVKVPVTSLDLRNRDRWKASHEPPEVLRGHVDRLGKKGDDAKPVILVRVPGNAKLVIVDGHHRTLAYESLGEPVLAWIGQVGATKGPWDELHSQQFGGPSGEPIDSDDVMKAFATAAPSWRLSETSMQTSLFDMSPSSVHVPGSLGEEKKKREMSTLKSGKRKELPDSAFAIPRLRALPLIDKSHAANARARLDQVKGATAAEKKSALRKIESAERKFGIKAAKERSKATRMSPGLRVSVSHPVHGTVEVRHMSAGFALPGLELAKDYVSLLDAAHESESKAVAAALGATAEAPALRLKANDLAAKAKAPVWNQLAIRGQFKGHDQGEFELTENHFREIVANFDAQANDYIPIDYHHASEMPPERIAATGAPAIGWVRALKVVNGELWGLCEWGDQARDQIRRGEYRYFSPAIRFKTKDRVSGAPVGARMSSGALTNDPFLDGMMPIAASRADASGHTTSEVLTMSFKEHSSVYMPKLRRALGLSPAAAARECEAELDRVCDAYAAADGADHQGIQVSKYCMDLGDAIGAAPHMEIDAIFDAVRKMIEAAIEEHEAEYHEMTLDNSDDPGTEMSRGTTGEDTMPTVAELEAANKELAAKLLAAETAKEQAALKLDAVVAETKAATVKLQELQAAEQKRADEQAKKRVALAMKDYALPAERETRLLAMYKTDPTFIEDTYPPKDPAVRDLDRKMAGDFTGGPPVARPQAPVSEERPKISIAALARAIQVKYGLDIQAAQNRAFAMAREQGYVPESDRELDRRAAHVSGAGE